MIIKVSSIADLYHFVGLHREPISSYFDVLTHQETYPDTHKMVPPHRRDFFSVIFLENQQTGMMHIDQSTYKQKENILFFQSPQHVFSFTRGESMRGFILFFKPEFVLPHYTNLYNQFPYFNPTENNVFDLKEEDKNQITILFNQILKENKNENLVKFLLLALLEKANVFYKNNTETDKKKASGIQLVSAFNRLVNNFFIEEKSVAFYAKALHVTPNYLNICVKTHTGKTAKECIANRNLLEAKNMLTYTDLDIAEVSHMLNFNDPSYFG